MAINTLDLARDNASPIPARDAFRSASALLASTQVGFLPVHICALFTDDYAGLVDRSTMCWQ